MAKCPLPFMATLYSSTTQRPSVSSEERYGCRYRSNGKKAMPMNGFSTTCHSYLTNKFI